VKKAIASRHPVICNATQEAELGGKWIELCKSGFVKSEDALLKEGKHINVVIQIEVLMLVLSPTTCSETE
jgi:hypothetical protein